MLKAAVCPGSFDPPTVGHINIIERGLKIFDRIVIAVAVNSTKRAIFSPEERVVMLKKIFGRNSKLEFDFFQDDLLVNYVRRKKAKTILRGIRTLADYEYEFQMALANRKLAPEIETLFMMTESEYSHISSSLIKEIITLGGSGKDMVPPLVETALKEKLGR